MAAQVSTFFAIPTLPTTHLAPHRRTRVAFLSRCVARAGEAGRSAASAATPLSRGPDRTRQQPRAKLPQVTPAHRQLVTAHDDDVSPTHRGPQLADEPHRDQVGPVDPHEPRGAPRPLEPVEGQPDEVTVPGEGVQPGVPPAGLHPGHLAT